ncbi:MAG: site-specific integrase [Lachnospiraceae bacterium]|nr:site-specific integrase [Lachnospiraceae bacterium]
MAKRKALKEKNGVRFDNNRRKLRTGETYDKYNGYVYRWTDQSGKRHAVYADTLEELREKEVKVTVDEHDGIKKDTNNRTVNDIYELWKQLKRGVKDSTMQNYIYIYDMFVAPALGKMKLTQVKKSDVKRFYNTLIEKKDLKISTIDGIHNVLHQVFQVAVDDSLIRMNPTEKVLSELKRAYAGDTEKRKALTLEQQNLFLDFLKEDPRFNRWLPVFYVMVFTGMRVGEITGLQWRDVDLDSRTVTVNHTLVYYNHRDERGCYFSINTPKTKAGERVIPMTEGVRDAFLLEKKYQEETGISCSCSIDGYDDFIFVNRFGDVHHQASLNRVLHRAMRECNLKVLEKGEKDPVLLPPFSCHVLRHTFATRLAESGVSPRTLMDLMGHADISTSMNIYVTLSEEFKKKELEAFEKYVTNTDNGGKGPIAGKNEKDNNGDNIQEAAS